MENFVTNFVKKPTLKGDNWYFNIPLDDIHALIDTQQKYEVQVYELATEKKKYIVNFVKKPTTKGDYWYFNIPIENVRSGLIRTSEKYEIRVFNIV